MPQRTATQIDKGKLIRFHDRLKREGKGLIRAARIVNKTTDCKLNGPDGVCTATDILDRCGVCQLAAILQQFDEF